MVVHADSGKNALQIIEDTAPDILILDIIMPYKDGFTIIKELREVNNDLPVLFLTDKSRVDDKVKGLELGADDYIPKPFSLRELHARVKAQLRRLERTTLPSQTKRVQVGPLTIDPETREIFITENNPLKLTKTEFDLFYYLAARQTHVVSHGELLQEVLGYEPTVETKSLVMHIANIRRKLEKARPGMIEIAAVVGVGYKLTPLP